VRPGDALAPVARTITREDIAAYADASGDRNPLHIDDGYARAAGFPSVIAHGMLTLGHLASAVRVWAGEGDVLSLRAQFRVPVFPGETIIARGTVREADGSTARLDVWVEVERDGGVEQPIRRSEAEIRLA
jgi:acyl dehydratase